MNIKEILGKLDLEPSKYRGQNFLVQEKVVDAIVDGAKLTGNDYVLEVGPGLGILTEKLAAKAKKVLAVELDRRLFEYLEKNLPDNVKLVNADIMKLSSAEIVKLLSMGKNRKYKIVANLPYSITSAFIKKFLELDRPPEEMILMVQKEVAERIVAKPGQMSLLTLSVQFHSRPEILFKVSRGNFFPAPAVDSAVIALCMIQKDRYKVDQEKFFALLRAGFAQKRKKLINNIAVFAGKEELVEIWRKFGWSDNIRAQGLSLDDWVGLYRRLFMK